MHIDYEFTWCDFLTPCPHGKDCMVGDYDCMQCENFKSHGVYKSIKVDGTESYNTYFNIGSGWINCKKDSYGDFI